MNQNSVAFVRQTGIDELRYEELILQLAKTNPEGITRKEIVDLLYISKDQAYRLLKLLVEKNKLKVIGTGRTTKYQLS